MSYTINGTCSICGGAVTTPTFWWGVVPPTPSCSQCGAVPMRAHGPVIPMQPVRTITGTSVQDIQEAIDRHNAEQRAQTPAKIAPQQGMSSVTAVWLGAAFGLSLETLRTIGPVQSGTLRPYQRSAKA